MNTAKERFTEGFPGVADALAPGYAPWSALDAGDGGIKIVSSDLTASFHLPSALFEFVDDEPPLVNALIQDLVGDLIRLGAKRERNFFRFSWNILKMFIKTYWPNTTHRQQHPGG